MGLSAYTGEHRDSPRRSKRNHVPNSKKHDGRGSLGRREQCEGKKAHTCVATHTTRDALFLFLDVGFCVEVEDDVGLFSFCDDGIYGEIKDGLFLFFTLPFCAPVAILERGDTVSCAVGGGLVGVVWRIIEVLLFCSFSGRGGGRGAVGRYETGGRL
jgi:hypothetical protein